MKAEELRSLQAPLKERYREEPSAALVTLRAQGRVGEGIAVESQTQKTLTEAGLHRPRGATACWPAQATCCSKRWPRVPE